MPAQREEVEAAEREGITIMPGISVDEVLGNGRISALRCRRQKPSGRFEGGRAIWGPVPDSEFEVCCSTVLVAIGEEPDPSILPHGVGIEISAWAGISAHPRTLATGRAGVFAGGDVVTGPKTVIDAVANGRRAAGSIHEYLSGCRDGEAEIMAAVRHPRPREGQLRLDLAPRPREALPHPEYVPGSFTANEPGFDQASARSEASRCFRCDAVYGCGAVQVVSRRGPQDAPVAVPPTIPGREPAPLAASAGGDR
jgi:hypothetical protein